MEDNDNHKKIRIRVSFPISAKGPYTAEVSSDTVVETVLVAAMDHFEVQNDPHFTYVLNHDGERQSGTETVGSLAGESDEVKFTLVKIITQG